jgi:hypothetical protein
MAQGKNLLYYSFPIFNSRFSLPKVREENPTIMRHPFQSPKAMILHLYLQPSG